MWNPFEKKEEDKKPKGMAKIVDMSPVDYFPNEEEDEVVQQLPEN